ncbi:molybdopterin-guanine dinucleotide biosynthesis protein MobB [Aeromonas sp. BIGb0405]|uniref:molybdopterin-guanine dinucleotide biosynthesis protein B n=1 Tax=Aeromonas sp. BIGb0405 TaxID=2940592 RepID=UPI002168161D|nr:molybdopterin-guanine dinucleotide biosynthesis protein MobB [Aeromonas sp. BIGb0405]
MIPAQRPLLGFVAWSGTGKTTLLERLIPLLTRRGLRLGVLKHTHHDFDMDQPGKDSYRLRQAGALQVMAASSLRHALICETPEQEPSFEALLARFDWERLDLLLVEGFKHHHFPKIELHRRALGRPLLFPSDPDIVALISNEPEATTLPQFRFEALDAIADFLCARLPRDTSSQPPLSPPLRLFALALEAMPNPAGEACLPGHLSQDANGCLQVRPASAFMPSALPSANCVIENPARSAIIPGERVRIRLLP